MVLSPYDEDVRRRSADQGLKPDLVVTCALPDTGVGQPLLGIILAQPPPQDQTFEARKETAQRPPGKDRAKVRSVCNTGASPPPRRRVDLLPPVPSCAMQAQRFCLLAALKREGPVARMWHKEDAQASVKEALDVLDNEYLFFKLEPRTPSAAWSSRGATTDPPEAARPKTDFASISSASASLMRRPPLPERRIPRALCRSHAPPMPRLPRPQGQGRQRECSRPFSTQVRG